MAEQIKMEGLEEVEAVKPKRTRKTATTENTETKPKTTRTRKAKVETEEAVSEVKAEKKAPAKKATKKVAKPAIQEFIATGKRKSSVARVRLSVGTGEFKVNGKGLKEYFGLDSLVYIANQPLMLTELSNTVDVRVNVYGGGIAGQAGAIRHGIARALLEAEPETRGALKKAGFLTRDSRMKERKKYGLKKARRAPQFSKR